MTSQPLLPTERSKDMRTKEEKAALLSWAAEFVARKKRGGRGGPPHPAPAPSPTSSQPYTVSRDATAPVHGDAGVSEGPPMAVSSFVPLLTQDQNAVLAKRIQRMQAELAALMALVVAPSSPASSSSSPTSASSASSGAPPLMATPPQATASHE
ncbi:hypothetical protein EDB85DRAFT_383187 [Lactarius pseudohatsudake]|nr:hypothetical protein EDB85DRAFT_383187 [Lactarius pseudohatsudake]